MAKKSVKEEKEVKEEKTKKSTAKKADEKKSNTHEIVIKIDGEDWKKAIDDTFKEKQKTAKVDGFRKGKVPRNVYEKHFGKESLFLDAADKVVQQAYLQALKDSELIPVVQPNVDLKALSEDHVEFSFKIITRPEVHVKKYTGLKITPDEVTVTDEEIEHELSHLLEEYTELVVKEDGKVENGDVAIIDFEGFKDGVAFDGGKGENYSLEIGSHTFIPGFEEQVIGMKAGEEKDIIVTFPEDYGAPDLAGCEAKFHVIVHEIKSKVTRELDEDFFEDLGMDGVDSEEKLRDQIKKTIQQRKELEVENKYIEDILAKVSEHVEVDIPQEMVDEEVDNLMDRMEHQLQHQGMNLDIYYQFTGSTEQDLRNQLDKEAYSNVLYRLMLEEIRQSENIEATDEETEAEIEKYAANYQMSKEDLIKEFGGKDYLKYDLEIRKTIEFLKKNNL